MWGAATLASLEQVETQEQLTYAYSVHIAWISPSRVPETYGGAIETTPYFYA